MTGSPPRAGVAVAAPGDEMYSNGSGRHRALDEPGGRAEGGDQRRTRCGVRAAMKPDFQQTRALATVDMTTGDEGQSRSQTSAWMSARPAAGVVVDDGGGVLVLARAALEKFGGDSLTETRRNIDVGTGGRWPSVNRSPKSASG